ncbi:MAG: methionine ABC transporter ATP-binding protein [Alphaproteobacteria bacterium]|nr:methionine ABC transporter ATP-binding protein [Alphaproteobacteria bacterium]MCW5743935.1 methionine ABC transporter ATP-binding protein [Alphaproteobacteria bacterium]
MTAPPATHDLESPAARSRPVIVFEDVRKTYAARRASPEVGALDGVSLSVGAGAIVGVIGRSGAGKSTLIRLVNGLEKPSSGTVTVDGTVISALDERGLREARRSIGMIFQHFNLLSSRTAFGNVALPLEIAGRPASEIRDRVLMLLELVGLAGKRDRYPAELSGGEKQRVGIARALATAPKVLLSDEATSALDPETTAQILALLKRINRELGLTILLITHEMAVVKSIAETVVVLEAGRIIEEGATFDIFAHPSHPTTRSFVGSVTGSTLPQDIAGRLKPQPFAGSQAVVKVVWSGEQSGDRVLGQLARALSIEVSLLHGQIDSIAGRPFGTLTIAIPDAALEAVVAELARQELRTEVLGHVA